MGFPKIYPQVTLIIHPTLLGRGAFDAAGPKGVTLHYSASIELESTIASEALSGYCYHLIIGRDGKVTQTCFFDRGTWHAGRAIWLGQSPNRSHIAFCLLGWGKLDPDGKGGWQSWAKTPIAPSDVVMRPDNITGKVCAWQKATPEQEAALEQACLWAIAMGISPADICDHSECAIPAGRKVDIGGMLSKTMKEFRARLLAVTAAKGSSPHTPSDPSPAPPSDRQKS